MIFKKYRKRLLDINGNLNIQNDSNIGGTLIGYDTTGNADYFNVEINNNTTTKSIELNSEEIRMILNRSFSSDISYSPDDSFTPDASFAPDNSVSLVNSFSMNSSL